MSAPTPGIYVPIVLFFKSNEDLDVPPIQEHILRLARRSNRNASTRIQWRSSASEECKEAIQLTRKTLDDNGFQNVLVIAGTGAQSTRETKKLCVDARDAGASHVLVLTPSTWPPQMSIDNIIRFHREVADASPIPMMIYNFPVVTAGQDLDSDTLAVLAEHPNIVGTKLSCGNIGKLHRLTTRFPSSDFAVFAGRTDFLLQGLLSGSSGTIAALVNILPKLHSRFYKLYEVGNIKEAMELQGKMGHADWAVGRIGGIGGIKAIVSKNFGYGETFVRRPLKAVETEKLKDHKHYSVLEELIALEKSL